MDMLDANHKSLRTISLFNTISPVNKLSSFLHWNLQNHVISIFYFIIYVSFSLIRSFDDGVSLIEETIAFSWTK